jgi:hypothetical protein
MSTIPSSASGPGTSTSPTRAPRLIPVAILVGFIICIVGGYVTGYLLTIRSLMGVTLLGVGALAGFVSRKITGTSSPLAGRCLVAACALSFCLAMISWYRWGVTLTLPEENGKPRDPTWQEAITRAPKALLQFRAPDTLLISGLCAAFGAAEAYRQAGRRYRLVAVVDD